MKTTTKKLIQQLGYDVSKVNSKPKASFEAQHSLLTSMGIDQPVILDIGAHRGQTASKYKQLFPQSKIYCFEPFPDSVNVLKDRFSSDSTVEIFPTAVSETTGVQKFYANHQSATNSLLPRPTMLRRYYPEDASLKAEIEVPVISIDNFVCTKNIEKLDILKMDIQGGELKALQGAKQVLKKKNILLIYLEIMFVPHYENAPLFYKLWDFLESYQYTLFNIYNLSRAKNGQLRQGDALFVHQQVRSSVIDRFDKEP